MGKEDTQKNIWTKIWKWLLQKKINHKIYNKLKPPDIGSIIKVHVQDIQNEWLGHAARMDGTTTVQQLL